MSEQCQFCGMTSGDMFSGPHPDGPCPVAKEKFDLEREFLQALTESARQGRITVTTAGVFES